MRNKYIFRSHHNPLCKFILFASYRNALTNGNLSFNQCIRNNTRKSSSKSEVDGTGAERRARNNPCDIILTSPKKLLNNILCLVFCLLLGILDWKMKYTR